MRSLGSEILSVATVLAVPLGLAAVFPYGALGFSPVRTADRPPRPSAAIVFLDEAAVARTLRAAKTMSRNTEGGRLSVDLLSADLPGTEAAPMMSAGSRPHTDALPVVGDGIPPFLPSRRAAAPVRISVETGRDDAPFPRTELLKLN